MFQNELASATEHLLKAIEAADLPSPDSIEWTPTPFQGDWGYGTAACFQIAAAEARAGASIKVPKRAHELAESLVHRIASISEFAHIEAVQGYINIIIPAAEYAQAVIDQALIQGDGYGSGEKKQASLMVEFSQPNTHKAFHVGHLRSAILGDTLCRILEFAGYDIVRANYIGDIGLHVIKWLWNYQKYHLGEKPETDITRWMGELYAESSKRVEEDPETEEEIRELYTRWDQRDPEIVELWKQTRQWSMEGFDEIYRKLDIQFDRVYSNSEAEFPGKEIVQELVEKGIATDERTEGPVIVKIDELLGLEKEKYRVLVILRSDNTALYSTLDLALARIKFGEYPSLQRSIYVVDVRQSLHFQQVFKTLELAGYAWADKCQHIPYELVNLPGNVVVASREGTVVLLEDLIREATSRARAVVEEKNPDLNQVEKDRVAESVGLGALKYPMLARENNRIVTFDWDSALDFNGQAAPYIQYAHVRANSILGKLDIPLPESKKPSHELHPAEIQLIDWISRFPGEVQRAAADYKPLVIANTAYELARAFSDFYMQCPVLKAESSVTKFRLRLVAATRQAIANSLNLLGIRAPEVM
jgi:arginyl-tRNA synthetase